MSEADLYDIAIIGAGAVGCALARELSRFRLRTLVLEAADDVTAGATRANSGIVHGGYAAKAGSRKADLCLAGNRMFSRLASELNFPYRRIGSVVLAFAEADRDILESLRENGRANGVEGLEILDKEEALRRTPRLNPAEIRGGLFCPGTGIVSPYEYAIAMAENAVANGVDLQLHSPVTGLAASGGGIILSAAGREFRTRFAVNAAGAGAAEVAALAGSAPFRINPRKGQYVVFRRGSAEGLDTVVFQPPTEKGKGILVTPTTWGNLLVGPDARELQDPSDLGTDPESLARIIRSARRSVDDFNIRDAIRVFSGNRPSADRGISSSSGPKNFPACCIWRVSNPRASPPPRPSPGKPSACWPEPACRWRRIPDSAPIAGPSYGPENWGRPPMRPAPPPCRSGIPSGSSADASR